MIEYKVAKSKEDFEKIYSFRKAIFAKRQLSLPVMDAFDELGRTVNFFAYDNSGLYANARLIYGYNKNNFLLPMEEYYNLSAIKKEKMIPVEFSRLLFTDNIDNNTIILFLTNMIQYAEDRGIKYLYTLANTYTDDPNSIRIIYLLAQVNMKLRTQPNISPLKITENPDTPRYILYPSGIINKLTRLSKSNQETAAKIENMNITFPPVLMFYLQLGFKFISIPVFSTRYKFYIMPMTLDIGQTKVMDFKNRIKDKYELKTVSGQEINCRTTNIIIQYVRSMNGDVNKLLKGIKFTKEYLTDENNWVDCKTINNMFVNARLLFNDNKIGYKIGMMSNTIPSNGIFSVLFKLLVNPLICFRISQRDSSHWNKVQSFKVNVLSNNKVEISVSRPSTIPTIDICEFHKGLFHSIPKIWGYKTSVTEVECIRKKYDHCKFVVQWESKKSILNFLYFHTIDRILTIMNAYKILKERNVLLQKKYSELNQKTYENIKLSKLLKRKNRELQSIVDKKIQELERTYKKKMNQKRLIFNKEKLNISENLTGIICHEIKSNLSSVNYLYDNIVKEDTLEKNRANFIFLLNHFEEKIQRDMFIRIINNVEKINNNYKSFDSAIHNTHQIINKSISLCQTILANYSMEGSAKEDILSIVKEYCQKQKINLMKYGIRLDLNIPMKLNGQFNKTHLLLLLTNIVNNSFEALLSSRKKQKKTIHIAVSGLSSSLDNELNIKISNNADKIPGQYLNQIFEPFYTTSAKKLGLGLAFCQRIAKFYEGDIKCISNTNSTTFYINLKVR